MTKYFIDSDVIMDVLANRPAFAEYAGFIFAQAESGKLSLCTSPLIISNVHYLLTKLVGRIKAKKAIIALLTKIDVIPVDSWIVNAAFSSKFSDIEDAIQYYTAKSANVDAIITRNVKDFKLSEIKVLSSKDACVLLKTEKLDPI